MEQSYGFSSNNFQNKYLLIAHLWETTTQENVRKIQHYTKNSYLESKVMQKLQKLYAKYDTILRILILNQKWCKNSSFAPSFNYVINKGYNRDTFEHDWLWETSMGSRKVFISNWKNSRFRHLNVGCWFLLYRWGLRLVRFQLNSRIPGIALIFAFFFVKSSLSKNSLYIFSTNSRLVQIHNIMISWKH